MRADVGVGEKLPIQGRRIAMRSTRVCTAASLAVACVIALLVAQPAQSQTYKVLYSFMSRSDGANPTAGLIQDAKGNLYGTTSTGDLYGLGTVFELSQAGKETVLHRFMRSDNGAVPVGGVIMDAEGNLYGTTGFGDYDRDGTVFKLSQTGKATVLHRFFGGNDGSNPYGGLVQDEKGNIYGTTYDGGSYDYGTVFELSREEKGKWRETVLHTFKGGTDGAEPSAGLIRDAEGNFYGTTVSGGGGQCWHYATGCGTVFKLDTSGKETVLYSFTGGNDGNFPMAALLRDAEGNLYGTTSSGGETCDLDGGCGTVFKVDTTGTKTVLYRFTGGSDGAGPVSSLVRDAKGNLYGTAEYGGIPCHGIGGCGVVFKLSKTGTLTVLHSFTGGANGSYPSAGVTRDAAGILYGTASYGGDVSCSGNGLGCGVVFKLTP
jgi:uncharacterized repeat protein (TIGR03803 family)